MARQTIAGTARQVALYEPLLLSLIKAGRPALPCDWVMLFRKFAGFSDRTFRRVPAAAAAGPSLSS
ncbi:hypothetical protein [Paracoccus mutanolyticus]|uniref:hypothetical protein n=1 Tax=Paracoccus mutanolyticus TaxID=1499308 RepID=UPI0011AEA64C|nr:hypothetical protein [Paracoccus mutanolyticus]